MKHLADYAQSEQVALRNEICVDATDDQINYFLRVCSAKSIDPFSGLMYMQIRRNKNGKVKASVQPTVDGSRTAANRTGSYAGSDEPEFDSEDNPVPKWCRVSVYRMVTGQRVAFTAKCRFQEFVPAAPNDFQWRSKPYHMLSKVTEVQALRKGFPEFVSATGEDDWDEEATVEVIPDPEHAKVAVQWNNAMRAFKALGKSESDLLVYLKGRYGGDVSRETLAPEHIDSLEFWYKELKNDAGSANQST